MHISWVFIQLESCCCGGDMVSSERKGEGVLDITVMPGNRRNLGLIRVFFLSFLCDYWQVILDGDDHSNVRAEVVTMVLTQCLC